MDFIDLIHTDGRKNMGGLQVVGYYAALDDIATFPTPIAVPVNPEDIVTISDPFVMKTSKKFHKVYSTQEMSDLKCEPQGEVDGRSFINKLELSYPGNEAKALGFMVLVNNSKMVFVPLESNGQMRIVGSPAFPAQVKTAAMTGKKTADRKGITLEVIAYGDIPAPVYTGTIPL